MEKEKKNVQFVVAKSKCKKEMKGRKKLTELTCKVWDIQTARNTNQGNRVGDGNVSL